MEYAEVIKALLIGAPASAIALLAYRRSRSVDAVSEKLGIATETRAGQAETRIGQDSLIANLQTDNALLRGEIKDLRAEVHALKLAVIDLTRQLTIKA